MYGGGERRRVSRTLITGGALSGGRDYRGVSHDARPLPGSERERESEIGREED